MATPVTVSAFHQKSHDMPDERRTPPNAQVDVVRLEGFTLGRLTFQPGWRWSTDIKPVVGTETCQVSHVGYAVSGRLGLRLPDGREEHVRAGESYTIPPGHDGWVEGDEPFVCIEVLSAEQFAKA
jgi:hypothetical protein